MIASVFKFFEKELLGVGFVYRDEPRNFSLIHKDNEDIYIELYCDKTVRLFKILNGRQIIVYYDYPNEPFEPIYSKIITQIRESEFLKPYVKSYLRREKIKNILKDE